MHDVEGRETEKLQKVAGKASVYPAQATNVANNGTIGISSLSCCAHHKQENSQIKVQANLFLLFIDIC
jgi:lysozyme family protein